ncbi:hypothetical protein ACQE3D_08455 [Methylomonas sp. MS20]|uniref:hypothetical protein n=1 Tax=unclassified Methylomonas TaxID=2608980 RepID=UPI0008DAE501|nr:hypothetical protein [Methylomonas sp. LWB]OHX35252.1 hypothetical protein BJL95_01545 [Methylomonas sp. LWB]
MNLQTNRISSLQILALFSGIVLVFLFAMHSRLGLEVADDGAFFLRYAENMLKGQFWVWNSGEAPVWGASAPLYPLIVAIPMALGLPPEAAIVASGLACASVSLAATVLMLGHRFGVIVGLAFLLFSALDTGIMYFSGAGLETPLTLALLTFALWTLLYESPAWGVGLAAGLLMVNKLDLVPVGGLLLLSHWLQDKRFPKVAVIIAAAIALAWYGFAWWYFGAPVPNSFLTKSLHQDNQPKIIDWTWFAGFVFWVGIHKWLTGLSVFTLWRKSRELLPLMVFLGGILIVHLVAYTIKYPFEPYNWYAMPALFTLLVAASIGLGLPVKIGGYYFLGRAWGAKIIAVSFLILIFFATIRSEIFGTTNIKMFASHHEFDRAEAGRWVAENTPDTFVVYTMWGNPAYYSKRKVLDGSFLNRKFEDADLIKKYHPEVLILQNNPGSTPMNPVFAATKGENYRVVKVFDKTYSAGMDYFFVVLVREDVLGKVRNIDPPRDLMPFVSNIQLGDQFGILKPQGLETLFVHPGAVTATSFQFDASGYLRDVEKKELYIRAGIAPNIPEAAIKRGAGNVHIRILQNEKPLVDDIIKVGEPIQRNFPIAEGQFLLFAVDNNGGADTDWLLLSIH